MIEWDTLIEWDQIDVHLAEHIDKLAEHKDEVVGRLVDAENTLSKAKDEVEQLETQNKILLSWSNLTVEEKQRVIKRFVAAEQKAATARKIEAMKAEHQRWEKQLSERLLDAEKRASAAEQELAILRDKHINEEKNDTGGILATSAIMGQMPLRQAVKNSNYPQSEAGAPHTQERSRGMQRPARSQEMALLLEGMMIGSLILGYLDLMKLSQCT